MSDEIVKDAIAELKGLVACRCNDAYLGRKLKDPDCNCDSVPAVSLVCSHIEALENELRDTKSRLQELVGDKINLRSELMSTKTQLDKTTRRLEDVLDYFESQNRPYVTYTRNFLSNLKENN